MLLSWTAHVSIHVSRQPIVGSSQVTLAFVVNLPGRIYGLIHQTLLLALSAPPAFPSTWVAPSLCSSSGWCVIRADGGLRPEITCSPANAGTRCFVQRSPESSGRSSSPPPW